MNKLIVHLGTPKTGTTAIQYFLHDNLEKLAELNFDFPDVKVDFPDDKGYAHMKNNESSYANGNFVMDSMAVTAYRQGKDSFDEFLDYVFPDIAEFYRIVIPESRTDFETFMSYLKDRLTKHNVILSSENLWTFRYDFLERFAKEFGDQLELIVYLRRQDKYIESMWNEVVKLGIVSDTVEEYLDFMLFEENDNHGIRYGRRLKQLSAIVGKENIKVRLYEPKVLKKNGGIFMDFLKALGIDPDQHEWIFRKENVNERIEGSTVNIKRVFNEYLQKKVGNKEEILNERLSHIKEYNGIFYRLSSVYAKKQVAKDAYFTSKDRIRMEKMFSRDNEFIAKEFFGKEEGEPLFHDNDWTTERNVEPLSPNEEAILRLLFEMCYGNEVS